MSRALRSLAVTAALLIGAPGASAAERVALVIGNSAYETQNVLANPTNDAADVGAMFRRLGFDVVEGTDLDGTALRAKIKEFRDRLEGGSLGVFYYSGHGIQVDGQNYLIPIDAKLEKPEDVRLETIDLDMILQMMRAENRITVVVLDACRVNPFARALARSAKPGSRAAESGYGGLAEIKNPIGTAIIYATDPNNVALDGEGRNSPFTRSFLKNAPEPGVEIENLVKRIRYDVVEATGSKQVPWGVSLLVNDVYLAGKPTAALAAAPVAMPPSSPDAAIVMAARTTAEAPATPAAAPPAPAAPRAGDLCDRLATDPQDTLRDRKVAPVRTVDTERAIPACEKAVAEEPKNLRFANQLGRAYLKAERYADALRVFKDAAGRGSPYASNEVGYLYYRGFGGAQKDYALARPWFEKAAQLGVPIAMTNLGFMYTHGIGVEKTPEKAVTWLRKGEALGDASAIVALALLHLDGIGVPRDAAEAKKLFTRAAEMDDPEAMNQLGLMAQRGLAGPQDFDAARRWLEKAAAYDSSSGMYNLGYFYLVGTGGAPRDYDIARDWFERSVRREGIDAMVGLAHMNLEGLGAPADPAKAREWLERAAAHDNSGAMVYLAHAHRDGSFGKVDEAATRQWLTRAAALDDPTARKELAEMDRPESATAACDRLAAIRTDPLRPRDLPPVDRIDPNRAIPACEKAVKEAPTSLRHADQLGLAYVVAARHDDARRVFSVAAEKKSAFAALWMGNFYERGLGVAADPAAARKWWEKAAALGSSDGLYNLAILHMDGIGVPKNGPEARRLFEKSAALGDSGAMRLLGDMHYFAKGIPDDNTRAREWYEKAAALDDTRAKRRLGEIHQKGHGVKVDGAAARLWFQRAAADGDAEAMRELADLYLNAIGGAREPKKARGLLEQAAASGNAQAMTTLAQVLLAGAVGDVDEAGARAWYDKAAAAGDETARNWIAAHAPAVAPDLAKGDLCDKSAGNSLDPLRSVEFPAVDTIDVKVAVPACEAAHAASPQTLRWGNQLALAYLMADRDLDAARVFRRTADDGSAFAALWMGNLHSRGLAGFTADPANAMDWWRKAAELGSPNAMFNIGAVLIRKVRAGEATPAETTQAREWFERAASLGEPDSMLELALIWDEGLGVTADDKRHVEWLRKSAEFGNGQALRILASRLYNGTDGPRDQAGARRLLVKAVEAGNLDAHANLAFFLIEGHGGPKDIAGARTLLEKGIARQNLASIVEMAKSQEKGVFGRADLAEARKFYRLAVDLGDTDAAAALARLK